MYIYIDIHINVNMNIVFPNGRSQNAPTLSILRTWRLPAVHLRYAELLRTQIVDSVTFLHSEVSLGSKVLVEGANAALLDIDFGSSAET